MNFSEVTCSSRQDALLKRDSFLKHFWDLNVYTEDLDKGFLIIIFTSNKRIETRFYY